MNKQKITFGKIQLNFKKDEPSEISKSEKAKEDAASISGYDFVWFIFYFQNY